MCASRTVVGVYRQLPKFVTFRSNGITVLVKERNCRVRSRYLQNYRPFSSAGQDELDFHAIADETLEAILNGAIALEDVYDDIESELAAGISFESSRKSWVINKQTPNRQIWFSSPISGPCRFELEEGIWRHTRDGTILNDILKTELNLELESDFTK